MSTACTMILPDDQETVFLGLYQTSTCKSPTLTCPAENGRWVDHDLCCSIISMCGMGTACAMLLPEDQETVFLGLCQTSTCKSPTLACPAESGQWDDDDLCCSIFSMSSKVLV